MKLLRTPFSKYRSLDSDAVAIKTLAFTIAICLVLLRRRQQKPHNNSLTATVATTKNYEKQPIQFQPF